MPVVDIETVGDAPTSAAQKLADEPGKLFGSERAGTWMRLRFPAPTHYAANDSPDASALAATFVAVLQYAPPASSPKSRTAPASMSTFCSSRPLLDESLSAAL